MRVTNIMMINNMKYNVNNNMSRLERLQYETSQGKKFRYPSDDPIGVSRSLKFYTDIAKGEQHLKNANDAVSWMNTTEAALNELNAVVLRAHELTVQAANGPNLEELDKIQTEIIELKESMIQIANSTYSGRRLFSGFQTDRDLIDKDGNYNINLEIEDPAKREVFEYNTGVAERVVVNTLGMTVFGTVGAGGVDDPIYDTNAVKDEKPYLITLFESMSTNLENRDQGEIQKDIGRIKNAYDNVLKVTAEFGARTNRMELTKNKLDDSVFNLKSLMSDNENVDLAEAFTRLLTEENVYRASLGVTGRIIQPSLMDFLR
ncbi:MAG: flagellar hook-associated protein FlgL [Tissierellia bacterium]|nr:flagellar hook-associated protein FlgL [Tissierellia bacterium]